MDYNASSINHMILFLLNNSSTIASSVSVVDNVQQINISPNLNISLPGGNYDLMVEMLGGTYLASNTIDQYALSWNVISVIEPTSLEYFSSFLGGFIVFCLLGLCAEKVVNDKNKNIFIMHKN
jgi:hypothetical protein